LTCAWDVRSPARRLAEAKAAGEICDVIGKLDLIGRPRGRRVNADAFLAQAGLTIPWENVTSELVDQSGNALWTGQAEVELEGAPALPQLPAAGVTDAVVDQTSSTGALE
jgi:hypothetical protein